MRESISDIQWDKKLGIQTSGRDANHEDKHHYPYEPTPYGVLERLVTSGYIKRGDRIVDYGCGKGRVGFFLHHRLGCQVTGIEYNEKIWKQAQENIISYGKKGIEILCTNAEQYHAHGVNHFYFFNPFSEKTLKSVMGNVLESYYEQPRRMYCYFYYPNDEYVSYLMTQDFLMFVDEIDCHDLFEGENSRERILIFEVIG